MIKSPIIDSSFSGVFSNKSNNLTYNFSASFKICLLFSNFALKANNGKSLASFIAFLKKSFRKKSDHFVGYIKSLFNSALKGFILDKSLTVLKEDVDNDKIKSVLSDKKDISPSLKIIAFFWVFGIFFAANISSFIF